jgi:hypothetical protein
MYAIGKMKNPIPKLQTPDPAVVQEIAVCSCDNTHGLYSGSSFVSRRPRGPSGGELGQLL